MAVKFRSQLNRASVAKDKATPSSWNVGFKYQIAIVDQRDDIDIDHIALMKILGFQKAYDECNAFYAIYPDSLGEPQSEDLDAYFEHLLSIGIYDLFGDDGYMQTENTKAIYEKLLES